jgi:tripartite-type tricarboxylate transporter receptor subunit TctC
MVISNVFVIRGDLPYKTIFDLKKAEKQIFVGGVGPVEMNTQLAVMLGKFLEINIKVAEFRSAQEIWLAMERKEVDALWDAYDSVQIQMERGDVRPLLRTRISEPAIINLPINEDLTTDPIGKKVMAMHGSVGGLGRFLVAPPGTPDDVMKILRDALAKVVNEDPEFKEDAKKIRLPLTYVSSEKCLEIVNFLFNQPEEIVKEFSKYVKF